MSRDEGERFRITAWPSAVQAPKVVAVPRLVALSETGNDEMPIETLSPLADGPEWSVTGPTHINPATGESFDHDDDFQLLLLVDRGWLSTYPGVEAPLADHAWRGGYGTSSAVFVDAAAPELVDLPDELFLREFLAATANMPTIVEFIRRWGPLLAPFDMLSNDDVVRPTPAPRRRYVEAEARRSVRRPEEDAEMKAATEAGRFRGTWEQREQRRRAERLRVAGDASIDVLDAVLDIPRTSQTGHLTEIYEYFYELMNDNEHEGDDISLVLRRSPDLELVSVRGYSLEVQVALMVLYQSVFESWIRVRGGDLELGALGKPPRSVLIEPWAEGGLPLPSTTFELLGTVQTILNEATRAAGPRVELTHPRLDERGIAYGRPVPRVLTAMCLQALGFIAEGVPARRCANETCGQWFSRQRGRAQAGQYRTIGVRFCSASCAKAQAQREYRRRRRHSEEV